MRRTSECEYYSNSSYVDKDQKNWHLLIPTVLMSLRSTPNTETSGFSPIKMLFGGEMRLPIDTSLIPRETLAKTHMDQLLDRLKLVHKVAKKNTEVTQEESTARHNIKAKSSDFGIAEQVLLRVNKHTPGQTGKLEDKWAGPYYIREHGPVDSYLIADSASNKQHNAYVNARHLKR